MKLIVRMAAVSLAFLGLAPTQSFAEVSEVRIMHTYALPSMSHYVVQDLALIQKHAKALGLGDIAVKIERVVSGQIANDVLLSGNTDIIGSSMGPLLTLWDKTTGAQKVRGMLGLAVFSCDLMTVDPKINSLSDYGPDDRIAMANVKTSTQAIILQMEAAKKYGWEERFRYDPLMVAMSGADAAAALVSGKFEVKSDMNTVPFTYIEAQAGARAIFKSKDFFGRMISATLIYTTEDFKAKNPTVYRAVVDAYEEAGEYIKANRREAAEIYNRHEPQKQGVEFVEQLLDQKEAFQFSSTPAGFEEIADYMHKSGLLRNRLDSWKDAFFDNVWDKDGN
ncbi:MAG: ABC transporter substrate-binding protein [Rhizobiaceae bacterium]